MLRLPSNALSRSIPADAESYNNLGEALGELKQYPRALEAFNRAISLDQKLLKAKYNQAVSYDRMGNFRYSEFVFRSLIKTSPTLFTLLRRPRGELFPKRDARKKRSRFTRKRSRSTRASLPTTSTARLATSCWATLPRPWSNRKN